MSNGVADGTAHRSASDVLTAVAGVLSLFLAMDMLRMFGGTQLLESLISLETHYFFALVGLLLPLVFLNYRRLRYLDELLALAVLLICVYFFNQAERILDEGWEFGAPETATYLSVLLWALLLKRCAGRLAGRCF